jgi:starch synthase
MKKAKVLFVSQEITPYLDESYIGCISRQLPQGIQEKGNEIRTFMPRFGCINERRNQLHEVIRLSGMNIIIDDTDHPLIIKVASIQSARMQIYFIDNEDYFQRKFVFKDKNNVFFKDNDERAMFFAKGVIETVKKLGWNPDIVHCHGWMSSLIPLYLKTLYKDNPTFNDAKIIYSLYNDDFSENFSNKFYDKIKSDGIENELLNHYKKPNFENISKAAVDFSDGVIIGAEDVNSNLIKYAHQSGKPTLDYQSPETYIDAYSEFYDDVFVNDSVLSE